MTEFVKGTKKIPAITNRVNLSFITGQPMNRFKQIINRDFQTELGAGEKLTEFIPEFIQNEHIQGPSELREQYMSQNNASQRQSPLNITI